jgi:hypothetical protein
VFEQLKEAVGFILLGLGGLVTWVLHTRRRASRDATEIAHDRAEAGLISRLQSERDEARAEAKRERERRTTDAETIARLQSDNVHLTATVGRLNGSIRRMVRGLPVEVREVIATDFAELPDEAPRDE